MTLKLYNTLTRKKEVFAPQDASNIRMYVCGPTVYDYAHIGNARPVIVFDVLFRLLRHLYGEDHVTYARNITDVDDKIIARAADEDRAISELTEETTRQFHDDIRALGVLMPEDVNKPGAAPSFIEPRATDHIPQMIAMIERLIASGHAYEAEGHVLFDVNSKDDYGKLAGRSLDEMEAGARVEVAPYKKGQMDFVLWKPSLAKQPGWESPWGRGRPGWHIECSAMSEAHLGESFDIHGGGIDLVFPHHENEVAQSECAHDGKPFARYWMHNGFLQVEGEKMSKSLGNFVTVNELLEGHPDYPGRNLPVEPWAGAVLRYAMLMTHYRRPIDWTRERLGIARKELREWATAIKTNNEAWRVIRSNKDSFPSHQFLEFLSDDLNTPAAIGFLRELFAKASKEDTESTVQLLINTEFIGVLDRQTLSAHISEVSSEGDVSEYDFWGNFDLANELKVAFLNHRIEIIERVKNDLANKGIKAEIISDGRILFSREEGYEAPSEPGRIETLLNARNAARKAKDFAEADRIRDELAEMGYALRDNPDGTTTLEVVR